MAQSVVAMLPFTSCQWVQLFCAILYKRSSLGSLCNVKNRQITAQPIAMLLWKWTVFHVTYDVVDHQHSTIC